MSFNHKLPWLCFMLLLTLIACGDTQLMNIREQVSTVNISVENEGQKLAVRYNADYNIQTIFCATIINGSMIFNNWFNDRISESGYNNATAFLQPGKNEIGLTTVAFGAYDGDFTYRENDRCELTLFGDYPNGTQQELSNLIVTIINDKPSIATSRIYPDKHKTPLINVRGTTSLVQTIFTRSVHIETIPRWRWVDATPIREDNPEHMKQLYRTYSNLISLMEKRDFDGLKMAWSLSNREKAIAGNYYSSPDDYFDAVGFESTFEEASDAAVRPRREWHEYKLKSFMGGRLVRLEDSRDHSPLRIGSDKKELIFTVKPYFSMIDGRIVVSR